MAKITDLATSDIKCTPSIKKINTQHKPCQEKATKSSPPGLLGRSTPAKMARESAAFGIHPERPTDPGPQPLKILAFYTREDGKKVVRVRKKKAASAGGDHNVAPKPVAHPPQSPTESRGSTSGLADNATAQGNSKKNRDVAKKGHMNAAGPVSGCGEQKVEIITLPGGRRVRRKTRRVTRSASDGEAKAKTLDSLLSKRLGPKAVGGSATVGGSTAEGEIIVRPDGTRVRVIRRHASFPDRENDKEGTVITRPDGTKVRQNIRKMKKPATPSPLEGFSVECLSAAAGTGEQNPMKPVGKQAPEEEAKAESSAREKTPPAMTVCGPHEFSQKPCPDPTQTTAEATESGKESPDGAKPAPVLLKELDPSPKLQSITTPAVPEGPVPGSVHASATGGDESGSHGKPKQEAETSSPPARPAIKCLAGPVRTDVLELETKNDFDAKNMTVDELANLVGELSQKLQQAEKRQDKLEKQLTQAGVEIADDIPYEEAREKIRDIALRMEEIGSHDVTHPDKQVQNRLREEYFKLEQEMERYNAALVLTEEYQSEQARIERKWEQDNERDNQEALRQLRRHMPVNVRSLSEAELTSTPSPNGKHMPAAMAKRFKRTDVLRLIRIDPNDIEKMHPCSLETMRVAGLTLTERRALYEHLKLAGQKWCKSKADKMTERRWIWYQTMKDNFNEALASYKRHVAQYGPPENHPYATRDGPCCSAGCPLIGKQCPVKADKDPDYTGDLGWTQEAEYEASLVVKSTVDETSANEVLELARKGKSNKRAEELKKHYKNVLFVAKASGSCEQMDESMDRMETNLARWIEKMVSNESYTEEGKRDCELYECSEGAKGGGSGLCFQGGFVHMWVGGISFGWRTRSQKLR
jgi:hypothetical protein